MQAVYVCRCGFKTLTFRAFCPCGDVLRIKPLVELGPPIPFSGYGARHLADLDRKKKYS